MNNGRQMVFVHYMVFIQNINVFSIVDVTVNFPENWKLDSRMCFVILHYFEDYYLWEVYSTMEVLNRVVMDVIALPLFEV